MDAKTMTAPFKGMFGTIGGDCCRLGMNGKIAIKTSDGYKTYDVKKNRLTNIGEFAFDTMNMFWVVPTNKVQVGDIILVGPDNKRTPRCVIKTDGDTITTIDYENSEVKTIVPTRHFLMGKAYFYAKVFCPFTGMLSGSKGFEKMMRMTMISQMMGGNNPMSGMTGGNNMMQMMLMSSMMGGNGLTGLFGDDENPLEAMFGGLDFSAEDASEEEKEDK